MRERKEEICFGDEKEKWLFWEGDWVCCWWNENEEREEMIWMRLMIWIVDDLYDWYLRGRCVFVCLSTMREGYFVCGGNFGGWVIWMIWLMKKQNGRWVMELFLSWKELFLKVFLFLQTVFSFHFVLHLHTHPPHKTLLYPSHDVYPDGYRSDCVDDDCCWGRWHTSTPTHNFKSLWIEQCWETCFLLCKLW